TMEPFLAEQGHVIVEPDELRGAESVVVGQALVDRVAERHQQQDTDEEHGRQQMNGAARPGGEPVVTNVRTPVAGPRRLPFRFRRARAYRGLASGLGHPCSHLAHSSSARSCIFCRVASMSSGDGWTMKVARSLTFPSTSAGGLASQ